MTCGAGNKVFTGPECDQNDTKKTIKEKKYVIALYSLKPPHSCDLVHNNASSFEDISISGGSSYFRRERAIARFQSALRTRPHMHLYT